MSTQPVSLHTPDLTITAPIKAEFASVLTAEAVAFVADLVKHFGARREALLAKRVERQKQLEAGIMPDFLPETKHIRDGNWQVGATPADLQDRRVEITGPVDRKMVINALNSGAKVFMADFEDAQSPTWEGLLEGHINLRDALDKTISYTSPEGKQYQLNDTIATLLVRPRGWHLEEKHVLFEGKPISGSLFDFGLYFFHNAKRALSKGTGPYFYLPKLESHLEARLWNDVFDYAQDKLGLPRGTIKATVLIETILASFEMDEILYELRNHCVGLNCGRWDYIFSFIKKFCKNPEFVLPDRSEVTMTSHFLRSYSQLLIKTCHRRGAHAMGGMAAQIPIKNDPAANDAAIAKVLADKEREASDGHDGTWVAHPALVPIAMDVFNKYMPNANQKNKLREEVNVTAQDLLQVPTGNITEKGLRNNVSAALQYMEAWLGGNGCVPINNLMEDAATAEIARAQLWQWVRYPKGILNDGRKVTAELMKQVIQEELDIIRAQVGEQRQKAGHYALAAELLAKIVTEETFAEFLTLVAYEYLP
ncbi:malate synthase A [Beggiatoa leptomitoformis]|uniref:Malate synthase n=1 Tax=Beggiatoa leptomitoformis TaxID=288004 RepID=A0A2N9YDD1_9GAMM|nr:malate synthase A [Beggiatoa leptomitoformis]ALG69209.1 malate synthase A [Beggiatoa leptomitoformis]AUI68359.1 malate synthase A [Beggiatoa leptomitoformis]